jgi:hypothetical protein
MKGHIIPSGKLLQVEYTELQCRVGFWGQYIVYLTAWSCTGCDLKLHVWKHIRKRKGDVNSYETRNGETGTQTLARFEVLKALSMKGTIFWNVTSCSQKYVAYITETFHINFWLYLLWLE